MTIRVFVRFLRFLPMAMVLLLLSCVSPAGGVVDQTRTDPNLPTGDSTPLPTALPDATPVVNEEPNDTEEVVSVPEPTVTKDAQTHTSSSPDSSQTVDLDLAIDDNFDIGIWDDSQWDPFLRSEYAVRQEGVLMFRTPVGNSEFTAYAVDSALPGLPMAIRRVSFAIKVISSPELKRGDLGAEVSCGVEAGRFVIFWGGPQEEMWINSVSPDGEDNLEYLRVRPEEENLVDVLWLDGEIAVRLNGGESSVVLPAFSDLCWINFSALLQQGEAVSGYIDDVKVWIVDTSEAAQD